MPKKKKTRRAVTRAWRTKVNKAIRTGHFGTHKEIAEAIGVSQGYVSNLIGGRYQTSEHIDPLNRLLEIGVIEEAPDKLLRALMEEAERHDEETVRSLIALLKRIPSV